MKKSIQCIIIVFLCCLILCCNTFADIIRVSEDKNEYFNRDYNNDGKYILMLDPGHGGSKDVAHRSKYFFSNDDKDILYENNLNLQLAKRVKELLDEDGRLEVFMTRYDDEEVSLKDRGLKALDVNADIMISIHFNAMPNYNNSAKAMGTEIWQSVIDKYKPRGLPTSILKEFNKNHFLQTLRGVKERVSGDTYWNYEINDSIDVNNGNEADYYGVIKAGARYFIPTIIVEHAFFTNDNDYKIMLNNDDIEEMAKREAKGILNWYFEN